jgi:syntaxin-binding protein 1
MLAGLPQFQEGKEAFSLHLNMASDAMNVFQKRRLADIASVEQVFPQGTSEICRELTQAVSSDQSRRRL